MEAEMKKMVQEKEKATQMANTTMEALPLAALPITTPTSAATGAGSRTKQLARSMEGTNLQTDEIKRLKTQVSVLQDQIKRDESNHLVEMQRANTLIEKLQKSEKESSTGNTLGRVKEII